MDTCQHDPCVHQSVYQYTGAEPGEALPAFGDGGYPLYYLDTDGFVLCAPCASNAGSYSACTSAVDVHYEGPPEMCDSCGAIIESAYGDPECDET